MKNNNKSGQALILVMLSVAVVMSVAVSLATRTTTDTSTARKDEESLRAFSAAEAGVEEALSQDLSVPARTEPQPTTAQIGTGSSVTTSVSQFPANPRSYIYPSEMLSGDSAIVWFASRDNNGNLTCGGGSPCFNSQNARLCFGEVGAATLPAVALTVVYEDLPPTSELRTVSAAFDPDSSRRQDNNFSSTGVITNSSGACTAQTPSGQNRNFSSYVDLDLVSLGVPAGVVGSGRLRFASIRMLYNSSPTTFAFTNLTDDLPSQGRVVDAQGVSGDASRRIQVYALYPEVPNMFLSALYSPTGVVK